LTPERLAALKDHIVESFSAKRTTFLELDTLRADVTTLSAQAGAIFGEAEIMAGLEKLQAEGKVYVAAEVVYLVM
jgi:hypothetical protein